MKTVIITGASSGLGEEYAKQIKAKYNDIESFWLIARRKDKLEALAETLGKDRCFCLPLDLTDENSYEELSKILADTNPEVEILVNSAGFGKMGLFCETDVKNSTSQIDLNCKALTAVTSLVLPYMQKGAQIINIASIASFVPNPRLTVYSSTKAFVYSFSLGLREELKPKGINVSAVCPGPMDTEFLRVANIFTGSSKMFDRIPHIDPVKVVKKSLRKSAKKKSVCTNLLFYRFYHLLSKLLPRTLLVKFTKV